MPKLKICAFDIETSDLKANKGHMFCACSADPLTNKVTTFRIDKYKGYRNDLRSDRNLVIDIVDYLSDADLLVTYYGKRFDIPFLNSRILYWRQRGADIPHLENIPHIDLYDTARRRLALHSNRLQSVSAFLGNSAKTSVDLSIWMDAAYGDKEALEHIVDHCKVDVVTLAEDYMDLRPLIRAHPHMGLLAGSDKFSCSSCGSEETQKRGIYVTESTRRQRLYCNGCGRWSSVPYREGLDKNTGERASRLAMAKKNNKNKKKAANGTGSIKPS